MIDPDLVMKLTRERDEAIKRADNLSERVTVEKRLADGYVAELEKADRQLNAQMQRAETAERERDEARREVERIREKFAEAAVLSLQVQSSLTAGNYERANYKAGCVAALYRATLAAPADPKDSE